MISEAATLPTRNVLARLTKPVRPRSDTAVRCLQQGAAKVGSSLGKRACAVPVCLSAVCCKKRGFFGRFCWKRCDNGNPIREAARCGCATGARLFLSIHGQAGPPDGFRLPGRRALGVCRADHPVAFFPLLMLAWKVGTCFGAAGNTVVFETCRVSSLPRAGWAEYLVCGWLAQGVVNIVTADRCRGRDDCGNRCRQGDRALWITPVGGISRR